MAFTRFIQILRSQSWKMLLSGLLLAGVVYWLLRFEPPVFTSQTLLNTGLVSGYNIENSSGARVDYNYANNEMENLINLATSNALAEELALRLLARYCAMQRPDSMAVLPENWPKIQEALPPALFEKLQKIGNADSIFTRLQAMHERLNGNPVHDLLESDDPFFSLEKMRTISVRRQGASDMIRVRFSSIDPAVCRQALALHTDLFIRKKQESKEAQSQNVLVFFENATRESADALRKKEDDLLAFISKNRIINYYEQTRYIAAEKENLDNQFFHERMDMATADSTLRRIENELAGRVNLPKLNQTLLSQREELASLTTLISRRETFPEDPEVASTQTSLDRLRSRVEELQREMRQQATAIYGVQKTAEGIDSRDMLNQWLTRTLDQVKSRARLKVFNARKQEFDGTYERFAPWGSQLKRAEREIDVAERAYLENLHSWNQAQMHQFNTSISGGLRIVDPPVMPANPELAKKWMLVFAAFFIGMLLTLGLALARDLFDTALKSPANAAAVIGLPVAGAIPLLSEGKRQSEKTAARVAQFSEQAMFQIAQQIGLENLPTNCSLAILSMHAGEGKSFLAARLPEMLTRCLPDRHVHLMELKPLLDGIHAESWAAKNDASLLVVRADRSWTDADRQALIRFRKQTAAPVLLVLNGVQPDFFD